MDGMDNQPQFDENQDTNVTSNTATPVTNEQAATQNEAPVTSEQTTTQNEAETSTQYEYTQTYTQSTQPNAPQPDESNSSSTISIILGISGLVFAILGGLLFGVIPALLGLAAGVVGLVFSIKVRKETNNSKGTAGLILGILSVTFGVGFAIGCASCSCGTTNYTCYGCIGGSCMAASDVSNGLGNGLKDLKDLGDAINDAAEDGSLQDATDKLKDLEDKLNDAANDSSLQDATNDAKEKLEDYANDIKDALNQ